MKGGDRPALEPPHAAFARSLRQRLAADFALGDGRRTVMAIAGESGSGKSITATSLAQALETDGIGTVVLHQDDYFLRPPRANHDYRCADLRRVGPHEVNLELLAAHVAAFRTAQNGVEGPLTDHPTDSFLVRRLDFGSASFLIVEGTYVLRLPDTDIRIFLEATHAETAERRRRRNRDVDAPIVDQVLAIEHELVAPQASLAHILVDPDFAIRR